MTILGIIVTQGAALLAHMAALLIGSGLKAMFRREEHKLPEEAAPTIIATEAEAYRWLYGQILTAPKRQLERSGSACGEQIGIAKSTFAKWTKSWVAEGRIVATRKGNTTVWTLPKLRRVA